jgi:hypothetical protein
MNFHWPYCGSGCGGDTPARIRLNVSEDSMLEDEYGGEPKARREQCNFEKFVVRRVLLGTARNQTSDWKSSHISDQRALGHSSI